MLSSLYCSQSSKETASRRSLFSKHPVKCGLRYTVQTCQWRKLAHIGHQKDWSTGSSERPAAWHREKNLYHSLCQATESEEQNCQKFVSGRIWGLECCHSGPGYSQRAKKLDLRLLRGGSCVHTYLEARLLLYPSNMFFFFTHASDLERFAKSLLPDRTRLLRALDFDLAFIPQLEIK